MPILWKFSRLLSEEELKSVIGIIHPSEHYYAKQQAERALEEVRADLVSD